METLEPTDQTTVETSFGPISAPSWLVGLGVGQVAAVREAVTASLNDPAWAPYHRYPQFLFSLFSYRQRTGSAPEGAVLARMMLANNVPLGLIGGGVGGGGGVNRANTIRSFETAILNSSMAYGITLTPEEISYIARVASDLNYSQEQLNNSIVQLAKWDQLKPGGLTANIESIRALASNYLVSVSDQTLQEYAKQLASGQATAEGIESFLRAQSKAMNPWLSSYIDVGVSPNELLRAARDRIAESLGLNPLEVDFTQSRFMKLATVTDEKGVTRLANAQELTANIRQDEAWSSTDEARNVTSSMAGLVAQVFGRSAF